jgi:uncharacterized protein
MVRASTSTRSTLFAERRARCAVAELAVDRSCAYDTAVADSRTIEPTRTRIVALDAIRGVALFAILMVNVGVFSGPWPLAQFDPWTGAWDRAAYAVVDALFANKGFRTFSLLFGIGFGLQRARADEANADFARLWRRRMGGLFVIGLVHAALLSTIDILVQYAVLGMLLYALRDRRDRTLLVAAAVMVLVPVIAMTIAVAVGKSGYLGTSAIQAERMINGYALGGVRAFEVQRLRDLAGYYLWFVFFAGWPITAMFVTGYVFARSGVLADLDSRRGVVLRIFVIALPVAVIATSARLALTAALRHAPDLHRERWIAESALEEIGDTAQALVYASGLLLLFLRLPRIATPFARLGRNSMTHYVLQSVVMSAIFFAGRLYGSVSPSRALAIAAGIYVVEIVIAAFFDAPGPLERAWRWWTYARAE